MVLLHPILYFYNCCCCWCRCFVTIFKAHAQIHTHLFANTAKIVKSKNQQIGPLLSIHTYTNWHHQFYIWIRNEIRWIFLLVLQFLSLLLVLFASSIKLCARTCLANKFKCQTNYLSRFCAQFASLFFCCDESNQMSCVSSNVKKWHERHAYNSVFEWIVWQKLTHSRCMTHCVLRC